MIIWKPIEEAPRDDRTLIFYDPEYGENVVVGYWNSEAWYYRGVGENFKPTHYSELNTPEKAKELKPKKKTVAESFGNEPLPDFGWGDEVEVIATGERMWVRGVTFTKVYLKATRLDL